MINFQSKTFLFTQEGYLQIQKEIEELNSKRPEAVNRLQTARELGDLSENGAYKAARFELSTIDGKLRRLLNLEKFGKVIKKENNGIACMGNTVTLENQEKQIKITLVGSFEANPVNQKISIASPLGKSVYGKKVGDSITVTAPNGVITYNILAIE